jgi:hypothetical protein
VGRRHGRTSGGDSARGTAARASGRRRSLLTRVRAATQDIASLQVPSADYLAAVKDTCVYISDNVNESR